MYHRKDNPDRSQRPSRPLSRNDLILHPRQRLINTSPPRCITAGTPMTPFVLYDTEPPPIPAIDGLAAELSKQTLTTDRQRSASPLASTSFLYPLELEIDSGTNAANPAESVVVDPRISQQSPFIGEVGMTDETRSHFPTKAKLKSRGSLLGDMITSGSQCTVHEAASIAPASVIHPKDTHTSMLQPPLPPSLPASNFDPDEPALDPDCRELEVDDNDGGEGFPLEMMTTLRNAAGPGGIRKHGLRYRMSQEAAARCSHLVRNVPRMRKRRDRGRHKKDGDVPKTPASTADPSAVAAQVHEPSSTPQP